MRIVVEQGTHKLTIRNVANAIGVTEPAVYRHFSSKHDLLVALLESLQSSIKPLFTTLNSEDEPFEVYVEKFLSSLFSHITANPAFALFVFTEEAFHTDAELRPILSGMLEDMLQLLEHIISINQENSQCTKDLDPSTIALLLLGAIRLTVTRWHLQKQGFSLLDQSKPLIQTFRNLFS